MQGSGRRFRRQAEPEQSGLCGDERRAQRESPIKKVPLHFFDSPKRRIIGPPLVFFKEGGRERGRFSGRCRKNRGNSPEIVFNLKFTLGRECAMLMNVM